MIHLNINSSGLHIVTQQTTIPSVYLDNWALMYIGCNKGMANKFIETLKRHKGTLEFSGMNLLELSLVSDMKQLQNVEELLDKVLPNLSFIDMIPKNVISREDRIITLGERIPPQWDAGLLEYFISLPQNSRNPLTAKGFFTHLRQNEIIAACRTFMKDFKTLIEEKRKIVKFSPKHRYAISKIPSGGDIQRATRYIYQDMVNSLIRDNINMGNLNNWRDFFHTVVPVAYCDFVLLDRTWAYKANEIITRLRKSGQSAEMAKVFSMQNIDEFWRMFSNFNS